MLSIDLRGRRALVTGGNSGIGAEVCRVLGAAGADVAINYLVHPDEAEQVAEDVRKSGSKALTLQADISDPDQVAALFAAIDGNWGGIDIVVNNAGMDGAPALSWEVDLARWRKVIEVNLIGAFLVSRAALKRMVAHKSGVIVNMSSVHERIPWSRFSAYTASKAGLSMMTKTLAQEAAPFGIRVMAVAPGAIKTPINENVWSDPQGLEDLNSKIPMARMGEPSEIARMVAVLASDMASYATGGTVFVDGGMTDYASFAHGG